MKRLLANRKVRYLLLLVIVDLVIFFGFNPKTAPSIVVVGGFLLLVLSIYMFTLLICELIGKYWYPVGARSGKIALLVTICLGLVIGLESIGQLSVRDMLAIIPLLAIIYFYLSYAKKDSPHS